MGLFRKKCKTYQCPNLHTNVSGFCDACQAKRSASFMHKPVKDPQGAPPILKQPDRPSAVKRGYDHSWHKFARDFLDHHPTCAICGKRSQCVDHKEIPAEIMIDMAGKFDLDPNLYQALCFSCNRRKAVQDRDQIDRYFKDKAKLASGVAPGGGVETFPPLITPAWSGVRDIEEKFSEVDRG
jgi:hypothetical protein